MVRPRTKPIRRQLKQLKTIKMGTPNFARPQNASKYFVVLTNGEREVKICKECSTHHHEWDYNFDKLNECEECKSTNLEQVTEAVYPDIHDYEDLQCNLHHEFRDKLGAIISETRFNDRNYPRTSIAEIYISKCYGDIEVEVKFNIIIQSGYYEGATLDYMISIYNGGEMVEIEDGFYKTTEEDILEDLFDLKYNEHDYSEMNKGLRVILSKHAKNWIERTITETSEKIEEIFEMYSEHKLNRIGVASNGEAFYCEAN